MDSSEDSDEDVRSPTRSRTAASESKQSDKDEELAIPKNDVLHSIELHNASPVTLPVLSTRVDSDHILPLTPLKPTIESDGPPDSVKTAGSVQVIDPMTIQDSRKKDQKGNVRVRPRSATDLFHRDSTIPIASTLHLTKSVDLLRAGSGITSAFGDPKEFLRKAVPVETSAKTVHARAKPLKRARKRTRTQSRSNSMRPPRKLVPLIQHVYSIDGREVRIIPSVPTIENKSVIEPGFHPRPPLRYQVMQQHHAPHRLPLPINVHETLYRHSKGQPDVMDNGEGGEEVEVSGIGGSTMNRAIFYGHHAYKFVDPITAEPPVFIGVLRQQAARQYDPPSAPAKHNYVTSAKEQIPVIPLVPNETVQQLARLYQFPMLMRSETRIDDSAENKAATQSAADSLRAAQARYIEDMLKVMKRESTSLPPVVINAGGRGCSFSAIYVAAPPSATIAALAEFTVEADKPSKKCTCTSCRSRN